MVAFRESEPRKRWSLRSEAAPCDAGGGEDLVALTKEKPRCRG